MVLFQHSARQTPSETITKNQHSKECNPSSQIPGPRLQSSLTCQENFLPQGNKNKNGFFCGSNDGTRIRDDIDKALKKEHSDSTEGISMVNSNESVNENYSLHSLSLLNHASTYASTYNCEPQQFPGTFGFIPEGPLKLYVGKPVHWEHIPNVIRSHLLIKASGLPNYLGCRIPVHSQLNIGNWKCYLVHYWDQQIKDLLQYGFLLDFDRNCPLVATETNHTSALQNNQHVAEYIKEELQFGAILGPFPQNQ